MRKCILLFSILIFTISYLSCQTSGKDEVPSEVKASFKAKYPGENDPDWEKDKNGNFESSFKIDGKHYRADYSPEGVWIETERSIKKKELPEIIQQLLKTDYDAFSVVEVEEVQHHSKGLFYDVELKKDGEKHDVEFLKNGQVIN
tara:strand:+ start:30705 stop:31139 length:435 start_codon:yes stop_codon:yes gene_type:complete